MAEVYYRYSGILFSWRRPGEGQNLARILIAGGLSVLVSTPKLQFTPSTLAGMKRIQVHIR